MLHCWWYNNGTWTKICNIRLQKEKMKGLRSKISCTDLKLHLDSLKIRNFSTTSRLSDEEYCLLPQKRKEGIGNGLTLVWVPLDHGSEGKWGWQALRMAGGQRSEFCDTVDAAANSKCSNAKAFWASPRKWQKREPVGLKTGHCCKNTHTAPSATHCNVQSSIVCVINANLDLGTCYHGTAP